MLPELEQGLVGQPAGEHREIKVNFPADYAPRNSPETRDFQHGIKRSRADVPESMRNSASRLRQRGWNSEVARGRGGQYAP